MLKTKKAVLKRLKITGKKKLLKRPIHQDHFNAKDTGNKTRGKRHKKELTGKQKRKIFQKYLPYC